MAYTKQTWADLPSKTTPINAERLTHIEDGIFNAAQTADTAASTAGTAAANVGIVSGRVETLTGRVNDLDTAVSNKVDKVAGKGLSTNDYDDTDKGKVDSLGTASTKNSTSVVTDSSDLVESGAVFDALGFGNKNNLSIPTSVSTQSLNGIDYTFHRNSDGAVTKIDVVGTATSDSRLAWFIPDTFVQGEKYKLTGWDVRNITQGKTVNFAIIFSGSGSYILNATDTEIEYTCNKTGYTRIESAIFVQNGTTIDASIYPMIRKASVSDPTYEPYHASVEETIPQVVSDAVGWDVGNLLDNTLSKNENGLTVTAQPDGSTIINGTYTGSTGWFVITSNFQVKANKTYWMSLGDYPTDKINAIGFNGYGQQNPINPTADFLTNLRININNGVTFDNLHLYPKIYYPSVDEQKCDNSVIGTVEDGTNPTKSYAVGEHFIRNGKFCTVTVAVTTSSTWTLGSNYVEGDIAETLSCVKGFRLGTFQFSSTTGTSASNVTFDKPFSSDIDSARIAVFLSTISGNADFIFVGSVSNITLTGFSFLIKNIGEEIAASNRFGVYLAVAY